METSEEAARRAAEWLRTPEGQKALAESQDRAEKLAEDFRRASVVDPRIWDMWVR
jgi:hypothetical protein